MREDLKEIEELATLASAKDYLIGYRETTGKAHVRLEEIRAAISQLQEEAEELDRLYPPWLQNNENHILKRIGELALQEIEDGK